MSQSIATSFVSITNWKASYFLSRGLWHILLPYLLTYLPGLLGHGSCKKQKTSAIQRGCRFRLVALHYPWRTATCVWMRTINMINDLYFLKDYLIYIAIVFLYSTEIWCWNKVLQTARSAGVTLSYKLWHSLVLTYALALAPLCLPNIIIIIIIMPS